MNDVLWSPGEERREATALRQFRRLAEQASGRTFPDYESLWRWSVDDRASFWSLIWTFAGVTASRTWETVLDDGDAMPGARWFTGARLNYAENLLRKRDDTMAIVCRGEGGRRRAMTFRELHDAVAAMSTWLGRRGIRRGDRVAGYLPNLPETIVAKLATASLGAVWSSSSPDFGTRGVLDRFGQIDPKVLITADGYVYGGRHFDSRPRVAEILDAMPGIGHVVVIPWADPASDTRGLRDAVTWHEVMATSHDGVDFVQVPFDHPLAILYSSGTTGAPKCIVHGHGGTLLQHLKEHRLHCDICDGDRLFYFSTCGWMMWNWQVSALATGATLAIYEGHPASPDGNVLWDFCQEERFTAFGASAKYFAAIEKEGIQPALSHDLEDLRLVLSTGSPLAPGSFDYIYREVKEDVQLASISGGTDIISCFVLGNPEGAVRRGEIQARGLGMAVDIFDDRGNPEGAVRRRWDSGEIQARGLGMAVDIFDDLRQQPRRRMSDGRTRVHAALPGGRHPCRWDSGTTTTAISTTRPISTRSTTSGGTVTGPRSRLPAAPSFTDVPTPCSIPAACASAPPRSTVRWTSSRPCSKSRRASPSARMSPAMSASFSSWSCNRAMNSTTTSSPGFA